jgi:Protein of unknown function (DUF3574)
MRTPSLLFLAVSCVGIAIGLQSTGPAATPAKPRLECPAPARVMSRLEMLFGTARRDEAPVTDEDWRAFLDVEVTPRFPSGLTTLRGPGQWRGSDGHLTREQTNILVIWHEPSRRADADIEAIRSAYKTRFNQESVMRVDGLSCVSF